MQIASSSTESENVASLLISSFKDHYITVYGTWKDPLFKAIDIGKMLGIKKIRTTILSMEFDLGDAHSMGVIDALGRPQETTMLTESGLYKVLFKSRKEVAQEFQKHVCDMLKQERLKLGERYIHDKNVAVAKMKETLLIDKHKGKSGVYFMKHIIDKIVKFGCSVNVTDRIKVHKRTFGPDNIYLDKVVETPRYIALESSVRPQANTTYIDEQDHTHTEIIQYDDQSELDLIYGRTEAASRMIALPEYNTELEVERERSKQEEARSKQEEFKYKQAEFKYKQEEALTRQLELKIKLAEMKNGPNDLKNETDTLNETVVEESWFNKNIVLNSNGHLDQVDLFGRYFDVAVCNKTKGKFRKVFEKYLQQLHPTLEYQVKSITFECKKFKGWCGMSLNEPEESLTN